MTPQPALCRCSSGIGHQLAKDLRVRELLKLKKRLGYVDVRWKFADFCRAALASRSAVHDRGI